MQHVFLPPEAAVTSTTAVVELIRFYSNLPLVADCVARVVAERDRLIEAAQKLTDLEHRAEQLEVDRLNMTNEVATQKRLNDEAADLVQLHRGILTRDQENHREAVALLAVERAAFEAEQRAHAEKIAAFERLKGLMQG